MTEIGLVLELTSNLLMFVPALFLAWEGKRKWFALYLTKTAMMFMFHWRPDLLQLMRTYHIEWWVMFIAFNWCMFCMYEIQFPNAPPLAAAAAAEQKQMQS